MRFDLIAPKDLYIIFCFPFFWLWAWWMSCTL